MACDHYCLSSVAISLVRLWTIIVYDGFTPVLDSSLLCFSACPGDGGLCPEQEVICMKGRQKTCLSRNQSDFCFCATCIISSALLLPAKEKEQLRGGKSCFVLMRH